MNKGNVYIFVYATVLVVVVAAILSFTAVKLKPIQDKNVEIEKKKDILKSVKIESTAADAEVKYEKYITDSYAMDSKGNKKDGVEAFTVNLKIEQRKALENRSLPIFECTLDDGSKKCIVPVLGKGLWGPIWGYVALNDDLNTVFGVTFAHKGETPGLGAEIDTKNFQEQFIGKQIFSGNQFVSVSVMKGVNTKSNINAVDGISGGTITSKGLDKMLKDCLSDYKTYFINKKK